VASSVVHQQVQVVVRIGPGIEAHLRERYLLPGQQFKAPALGRIRLARPLRAQLVAVLRRLRQLPVMHNRPSCSCNIKWARHGGRAGNAARAGHATRASSKVSFILSDR